MFSATVVVVYHIQLVDIFTVKGSQQGLESFREVITTHIIILHSLAILLEKLDSG